MGAIASQSSIKNKELKKKIAKQELETRKIEVLSVVNGMSERDLIESDAHAKKLAIDLVKMDKAGFDNFKRAIFMTPVKKTAIKVPRFNDIAIGMNRNTAPEDELSKIEWSR